ncbi:MAG: hypothetical protein IJ312_01580 [Treponema sp.]|nr:hypothetical protein [Treponema sp.]
MKKIMIICSMFFFIITFTISETFISEPTQSTDVRYRLFSTQNIWTFLKLDTMTGKIWQVQFSVEEDVYRIESVLSLIDISEELKLEKKVGRFTLFPTKNMYNFILLDQIDGYTYQVQWSVDKKNRFILPISN